MEYEVFAMKALVYHGPGRKVWEEVPDPGIKDPADAIVKMEATTICGTDLHILKGDVPAVTDGRILGHEGAPASAVSEDARPTVNRSLRRCRSPRTGPATPDDRSGV